MPCITRISYLQSTFSFQSILLPSPLSSPFSLYLLSTHYPMDSGEGNGTPLQHSCLENPMGGGAWWAAAHGHGVAKSQRWVSDFIWTSHCHALEKEMATHSTVLAWRIPGTGEPGGLPSMGSHRVGHNWSDLAAAAAASHGQRSLVGYSPRHRKESDMTEAT